MENSGKSAIALLQGEVLEERLGKGGNLLLLTNKRLIRTSQDEGSKAAAVAFLDDIVLTGLSSLRRNPGRILLGIALIALGVAWLIYRGSTSSYSEWLAVGPFIGGLLFGLLAIASYIWSGGSEISFNTAGGAISCTLNRKASAQAYPFVNRCLELRDGGGRGPGRVVEWERAEISQTVQ